MAVITNMYLKMLQRVEAKLLASIPKKFKLFNYKIIALLLQTGVAIPRGVDLFF